MSDERFAAIEGRMDRVETRLGSVETTLGSVETRLGDVERGLTQVRTELSVVRIGLDEVRGGLDEVRSGLSELDRNMRVLHEDTIARIAALAPDFRPIRREFQQADARLREEFDGRLIPLEAAARRRRGGPRRG